MNYETYQVRVYPSGTKEWYLEDKLHRTDGPAVEYFNGSKKWFFEDKLHRTDGPAVEYSDGSKKWYLEGKSYSEEEWKKKVAGQQSCDGKIVEIDGKKYELREVLNG